MIYVVNFADRTYEQMRRVNTQSAYRKGKADGVFEFGPNDIDESFRAANESILAYKRGAGLWVWKPYMVNKALNLIGEGEWLFYCDAGTVFINRLQLLVDCAVENNRNILLFEQPLLNRQFTKAETFAALDVEDGGENQLLGGYILLRKCKESLRFIANWSVLVTQEELVSPEHFHHEVTEAEDFIAHREDQSLLTLLRIKEKMPVFRDPSDYGEMPFLYNAKGTNRVYHPMKYPNSTYPTIVLCCRRADPNSYMRRYLIKRLLNRLGILERFYI